MGEEASKNWLMVEPQGVSWKNLAKDITVLSGRLVTFELPQDLLQGLSISSNTSMLA
jgi:hypothetical protein